MGARRGVAIVGGAVNATGTVDVKSSGIRKAEPWTKQPEAQPGKVHSSQWQHAALCGFSGEPMAWQCGCVAKLISDAIAPTP